MRGSFNILFFDFTLTLGVMAAEIIFYAILIYFVYKLVFDFILPVSQAGKQMKQQFRDVQNHMHEQQSAFRQQQPRAEQKQPSKAPKDDYIDFEEIKK